VLMNMVWLAVALDVMVGVLASCCDFVIVTAEPT